MTRDFSKPYTKEELDDLAACFKTLPTYTPGGYVLDTDIPQIIEMMGYPRTKEQAQAYADFHRKQFGGIVTLDKILSDISVIHETSKLAKSYAEHIDLDKSGTIEVEEFGELMKLLTVHDPRLGGAKVSFEEFVSQADKNKDGKVSIEECAEWVASIIGSL